jgi:hypothetical protein
MIVSIRCPDKIEVWNFLQHPTGIFPNLFDQTSLYGLLPSDSDMDQLMFLTKIRVQSPFVDEAQGAGLYSIDSKEGGLLLFSSAPRAV